MDGHVRTRPASFGALVALVAVVVSALLTPSLVAAAGDSDRDGLPNDWERTASRTDPLKADTDGDGLGDGLEDPDKDTLTNRMEYVAGTDPRLADTNGNGVKDAREDPDKDGLRTGFEFSAGTHPKRLDTDGDGLSDRSENPDNDGLNNWFEQLYLTHPRLYDTDGDGWSDGAEHKAGTDPRLASSHPTGPAPTPTPSPAPTPSPTPSPVPTPTPTPRPTPPAGSAPILPGAPSCTVFPADNVWNVPVDGRAVASNSTTMLTTIGLSTGLHMDFGSYAGYGIPWQVVSSSTPRSTVTFDYDEDSDHVPYPIPASPLIEGGSDGHILLVDRDACRLYELFAARKVGSAWYAGSGATWDLGSNALRTSGWTSADAAGLPILPGLVRYDEVAAGQILHALRFTTDRTRTSYIYPARHQAGESSSSSLPPMGLRVRLKASYDTSGLSPQARVIADALKRYGMILADNGSDWYVSGTSDPRFDDDVMHELDAITGRDLEVVDTTSLVNGP